MKPPTIDDLKLRIAYAEQSARTSFWAYRRHMRPDYVAGWWQAIVALELQRFYREYRAGMRPQLIIEAPPQHGKSTSVIDFICWLSGQDTSIRTIYTSFSERLGMRANLACQRAFDSPRYQALFPGTKLSRRGTASDTRPSRTRDLLEFVGQDGYFRNTTVRGAITGESLDIGIVDDPMKGREDVGSPSIREKTWDWFTDDFFSRFSRDAGMIVIATRWHVDDPIGRLRQQMDDQLRIVSYPAIATHDERYRKAGEALFPELKPLDFLEERRRVMASADWEALYQQNPQIIGGNIIKVAWFGLYRQPPVLKYRTIYADTAQKTKEHNDYSVFQCWGYGSDGKIYLLDQIRGKWEAPDLLRRAEAFWAKHAGIVDTTTIGQLRKLMVEDKSSGTGLIQQLRNNGAIPVASIERTKDKYTRLLDVLGYVEAGYVMLPEGAPWLNDFLAECEAFSADDSHVHDDQVDPMIDAVNNMIANNTINIWERLI